MKDIVLTLILMLTITTLGAEAPKEASAIDLHSSIGKEVSISGVLNARGKLGAWVGVGEEGVYIYSKKDSDESSREMQRIYALDGRLVVVTGLLRYQQSKPGFTPLMSAVAEHYWFEATEAKVEEERQPNQALQTTPMTRSVYERTIEFGHPQRGV